MENNDQLEDLSAMIKITDIQRIEAYKSENKDLYNQLNVRYEYLTDQYFELIKKQRETEMDIYTEQGIININKGKLNLEKEYGKR